MGKKGEDNSCFMNRVGEKFITMEGYSIEIIEYVNENNCSVIFDNSFKKSYLSYGNVKRGIVSNPFHILDNGTCLGVDTRELRTTNYKISLIICKSFINRCLYKENKFYSDVSICNEWLIFNKFYLWWLQNWNLHMKGWQLDKDILVKGNKVYSPETCCFVPREVNIIFTRRQAKRGKYPIGVRKNGDKFISTFNRDKIKVYIGTFNTPEEAFQAYKTAKEEYIKEVANKWKNLIAENVYKAMYNYEVEITD